MPNAKRIYRDSIADEAMEIEGGVGYLLRIAFESNGKIAVKAAWILDIIACRNHLLFVPYINIFCNQIHQLTNESAKRPFAKVASILSLAARKEEKIAFSQKQQEQLIETHFDWLTNNSAIAVKVYSMETLYQLGYTSSWVHPELKLILVQYLSTEAPAYRAHGKKIIKSLHAVL
ncbi:MAG: hypothetical protein COB60_07700 [Flavobacteriaceae bacterium]|nr:MAG: hypothetical protein COB60_07700 [Flavobacteriaceae bacterium]